MTGGKFIGKSEKLIETCFLGAIAFWILNCFAVKASGDVSHAPPHDSLAVQTMSLDVTNTDISDVIRMVSRGYNLSIVVDKNVKGPVSLHFASVPIMEGVTAIARALDLDVIKTGNIYHLCEKQPARQCDIAFLDSNRLKVEVRDADVRAFLEELSKKSGVSIVYDEAVQGTLTGKLINVPFDIGLRALLEGNGYKMTNQKGIIRVTSDFDAAGSPVHRHAVSTTAYPFYVNFTNNRMALDAENVDLDQVIRAITKEAGVQIVTYGDISGKINVQIEDVSFDEAMDVILSGTHYTYIRKGKMILIGDRNAAVASGQALSTSEMVPLNHLRAEDVPAIIPVNIPAANIKVVKEQNALLISGTSIDIARVKDFLTTIDIPTPQVVVDVIVVETTIDNDLNFGLSFGQDASVTNNNSFPNIDFSRSGADAQNLVTNIIGQPAAQALGYLGDNFFLRLQMAVSDDKAKVLAQPSITVLNGHKASINVGQTQYFKIVNNTATDQSFRFQPISFGINVNITPWITPSGQITTDVSPEISNAMGINSDGYPNVFTRSVSTTVMLNNNETLVLGGLIRRDQDISHDKVPILGDIPILGNLFKTTTKTDVATNLTIYMTPHIINQDGRVDINAKIKEVGYKDIEKNVETAVSMIDRENLSKPNLRPDSVAGKQQSLRKETLPKGTAGVIGVKDSLAALAAAQTKTKDNGIIDVPQKGKPEAAIGDSTGSGAKPRYPQTYEESLKVPANRDDLHEMPPR